MSGFPVSANFHGSAAEYQVTTMNRPTIDCCQQTYRLIQAHCAIRTSTRVGQQLRVLAGAKGDIDALTPATLQTTFAGRDYAEALRLVELAIHIRKKFGRHKDDSSKPDAYTEE